MNADGFAVKTTISQMGNVARTQLKSQQSQVNQADGRKPNETESRVEQVRQTEETQKTKLDPDARKERGRQDGDADPEEERDEQQGGAAPEAAPEDIGRVVDFKA